MLLNNQSIPKLKDFDEYLNKIDKSTIYYVTGSQNKKHIDDTFNLYFENISENNLFDSSKIDELKAWFIDISNYHKSTEDNNYPKVNKFKSEAILFNGQIILKECFNLLHLITKYHTAYILKTEYEDELSNTLYHISQDKQEIKKKYNKFNRESKKYRKSKEYRAPFILMKKILRLLLSDKSKFRVKFYIYSIALNYNIINWDKLLGTEDTKAKEILAEVLNYFMYINISENKIKNSLMILVYNFLHRRMLLKDKDALYLTNQLSQDILYDLDNKQDYRKQELSQNIYVNSVFNYLPIFAYENPKNKSVYTTTEENKIIQTIKKQSLQINKLYNFVDNQLFIDSFKNSHIDYVMQDLIYLYTSTEE